MRGFLKELLHECEGGIVFRGSYLDAQAQAISAFVKMWINI
jgi:hypothetical protein